MSNDPHNEPQLYDWEITYRSYGYDEHKRRVRSLPPKGGDPDGWLQLLDQEHMLVFSIRTEFVVSIERVTAPINSERVYGDRDAPGKRPTAA